MDWPAIGERVRSQAGTQPVILPDVATPADARLGTATVTATVTPQ
jgi:hypothetical protein